MGNGWAVTRVAQTRGAAWIAAPPLPKFNRLLSSAPAGASAVVVEFHRLAAEGDMHRYPDGFPETLGLGARQHLAVLRCNLVRVRGDHRIGLDQVVDHIGRFRGARSEAVTDVHDSELGLVIPADDQLLLGRNARI